MQYVRVFGIVVAVLFKDIQYYALLLGRGKVITLLARLFNPSHSKTSECGFLSNRENHRRHILKGISPGTDAVNNILFL